MYRYDTDVAKFELRIQCRIQCRGGLDDLLCRSVKTARTNGMICFMVCFGSYEIKMYVANTINC